MQQLADRTIARTFDISGKTVDIGGITPDEHVIEAECLDGSRYHIVRTMTYDIAPDDALVRHISIDTDDRWIPRFPKTDQALRWIIVGKPWQFGLGYTTAKVIRVTIYTL